MQVIRKWEKGLVIVDDEGEVREEESMEGDLYWNEDEHWIFVGGEWRIWDR